MRRIAAIAVLLVTGLASVACGVAEQDPRSAAQCPASGPSCVAVPIGQPVFIGSLFLLSDPVGLDAAQSVTLAIDYLDGEFDGVPGQLMGHDVVVLVEDDQCSSAGGRAGALRLAQERSLIGILGTSCSSAALGAADRVLAERNILLVSPSNTAPGLTDEALHQRSYFRTAFNDLIQASSDADFAFARMGWTSAAAVHRDGDAYTTGLADAFTASYARLGGEVLGNLALGSTLTPAQAVRRLAGLAPQVIFMTDQQSCVDLVLAIRADRRLRTTPIVVPDACQTPDLLQTGGPSIANLYASGPDFSYVAQTPFYRDAFLPAYRRLTGANPTGVWHPQSWDATNLLFDAIRRSAVETPGGGLSISREALRRAFLQVQGYHGLSGSLTCSTLGDCAESARIGVYRYPAWPVNEPGAKPVFSQLKTLAQVTGGG